MHVVNTIAPVFLIIALGFALRRGRFLSAELVSGMSRLAYWIALPVLLFHKIAAAPQLSFATGNALVVVVIGAGACMAVAWLVTVLRKMPGTQSGTFVQAAFRGNLTFIGLAVIIYAFADHADAGQAAQTTAVLTLAVMVPLQNVLSVIVLLAAQHRLSMSSLRRMAKQMVTNPMLLACLAGILWSLTGMTFPSAVDRTLGVVGQLALPAALLAIGGTLAGAKLVGRMLPSVTASIIKVALGPAVGYLAATAMGAGPTETAVALVFLACPTAVASYVLADQLGGDSELASGAIVVSTICSIASFSVVLALT